jgi:predicted transcriptional regulator
MERIHIWSFPCDVSVLLDKSFLIELRSQLKRKYGGWRRIHAELCPHEPFDSFSDRFDLSYRTYRPLATLVVACNKTGSPLSQLEKSIRAYRTTRGRAEVSDARLPVRVSPIFNMLIAHIFGDGCCQKGHRRELNMNYRQYDPVLLSNFIKKAEVVFGRLKYRREYFYESKRFYLPSVCASVLAHHYSLGAEDFLSHRAVVPQVIFSKPRAHMVAFLTAFIIDEASIDSSAIVITLCNKELVDGLGKLCGTLGYAHTVRAKTLYILADGVRRFWRDYLLLKKRYPEVNMGYREEAIKDFILRKNKYVRTNGEGKCLNNIIVLLSEKQRTINELSKILTISRQGARFHIKKLQTDRVVEMVGEGRAGGFIYSLKEKKVYPASTRGMSRASGVTRKRIQILLKKPRTTHELSHILKINPSSVRDALNGLESQGKIRIRKKIVPKTHPAYLWGLR